MKDGRNPILRRSGSLVGQWAGELERLWALEGTNGRLERLERALSPQFAWQRKG